MLTLKEIVKFSENEVSSDKIFEYISVDMGDGESCSKRY